MRCRKVFYSALSCAASLWGGAEVCLQRTSVVSGAPVVQPRGGRQLGTVASIGGQSTSRVYVPQKKQQKQRRVSFSLPRRNLGLSHGNQHSRADVGSYFFVIHATLVHLQYFFTAKSAASIE